ncbi:NUDIX hydrolase [Flavobacterium aestuarii]|uniref:NUDIX hydrolase n=1 Tax=Flavobacterium aestuarii TaxID=3149227 RepID=UPI0032B4BE56
MKKGDKNERNGIKHYSPYRLEVDCVIFNLDKNGLKILLVKHTDNEGVANWRLANDCIKKGETITSTAHTILKRHTGSSRYFIDQLKAFGYPSVSSLQENISIAYYGLIKNDHTVLEREQTNTDMKWIDINEIENLNDKDKLILDFSLRELRRNICQSTIGFNLLPEKFTLLQVVHLYEKILGIEINKSNFRRKILQLGLVQDLDEKEENVAHRAAKFYTLKIQSQEIWSNGDFNFIFDKKIA